MTKDILMAYSDQQEEVKELRGRIDKINRDIKRMENGECIVSDTVTRGKKGKKPLGTVRITGFPTTLYEQKRGQLRTLRAKLELQEVRLLELLNEVENYIEGVENSRARRILRYLYLDNLNWTQVGHRMGKSGDACRKDLERFL